MKKSNHPWNNLTKTEKIWFCIVMVTGCILGGVGYGLYYSPLGFNALYIAVVGIVLLMGLSAYWIIVPAGRNKTMKGDNHGSRKNI